jgi:hypothetical protein
MDSIRQHWSGLWLCLIPHTVTIISPAAPYNSSILDRFCRPTAVFRIMRIKCWLSSKEDRTREKYWTLRITKVLTTRTAVLLTYLESLPIQPL